eukprot:2184747-Amphidinium_carterae.1
MVMLVMTRMRKLMSMSDQPLNYVAGRWGKNVGKSAAPKTDFAVPFIVEPESCWRLGLVRPAEV